MSSDKSAIERTQELLDELGVKHVGGGGMTKWTNESGCVCRAYTRPGHLTVDVAIMDASPEQAIAATLGTGTCHEVWLLMATDVGNGCEEVLGVYSSKGAAEAAASEDGYGYAFPNVQMWEVYE